MPAPQDGTYERRLAAVLIAMLEHEGRADDPSTLARASAVVLDTLRAAGGDAEPLAADRIVGVFDTVTGAVEAGLRAHARLVEEGGPSTAGMRIGVHAADVVTNDEGRGFRDGVTAATALAARAPRACRSRSHGRWKARSTWSCGISANQARLT